MNSHMTNWDHAQWQEAGLKDFGEYAVSVEYVNQTYYGDMQTQGDWYYCDDEARVIYYGTFGNDESPGSYIHADLYDEDEQEDYEADKAKWEAMEEYAEDEEEEDGTVYCPICGDEIEDYEEGVKGYTDDETDEPVHSWCYHGNDDWSCNQCQAMMIQGTYCHETGCPNEGKVKRNNEWVRVEEDDDEEYEDESDE